MTKIGIVSDIHGDIVALDLALGHLRRMGCATILCPGDLLDVEPFGEEVVQRIKAEGVVCIRGNHERWALERRRRRPEGLRTALPGLFDLHHRAARPFPQGPHEPALSQRR